MEQSALWVLEGVLSLPVDFGGAAPTGKRIKAVLLDFSNGSGDGFLEIAPASNARTGSWWSASEDVGHEFRASVRATDVMIASLRARSFLDAVLDRVMVVTGVLPAVLRLTVLYNEDEVDECRAGARAEYTITPMGEPARRIGPIRNPHAIAALRPGMRAQRALRWFRKAMTLTEPDDRFLAFYFSLECISNDVRETIEKTHRCRSCGGDSGIGKSQTDGVRELIARHPELPHKVFGQLAGTRAALVHGSDDTAKERAKVLEPIIQRLALDGIAISLGLEPASVSVVDTRTPEMGLIATADYAADTDPSNRWGEPVREAIARLRAEHSAGAP